MSLIQPEINQVVEPKAVQKLSDFFIHATEEQCRGAFEVIDGDRIMFCAVGLLAKYAGQDTSLGYYYRAAFFMKRLGVDPIQDATCPHCLLKTGLVAILPHLNDVHSMTFKEIGLWLKSQGF